MIGVRSGAPRRALALLALAAWALAASACSKRAREGAAVDAAPATAPRALDPRLAAMAELAFVPSDVEALLRVDLADVAARSPDPGESLKSFDFLLRAQQPAAWEVLSGAGVAVGRDITTLFLIIGPRALTAPNGVLVAGLGGFDDVRLAAELERKGAKAASVDGAAGARLFRWPRAKEPAAGAAMPIEQAPPFGDAAVGVAPGLLLFGSPELVRAALAVRAGAADDVRRGPLATELVEVDARAMLWGVAVPGEQAYLPSVVPGLKRARFATVLAAPGKDLDGMMTLTADFSTASQAEAFRGELESLLRAAALVGASTPLGDAISALRRGTQMKLEGTRLIASSTL